ncbi:MAG TPA: GLUG motif-containing protein [Bdellovibrionales bacterium]|nr:GLUG motif-containing protein [Bdellovibrionales bacterium]
MIKNGVFFILLSVIAACAPGFKAVENDGPNAGDDVAGEFVVIASQVAESLKRIDSAGSVKGHDFATLRERLTAAIRETRVESRERVYDSSGERSAVNYPDRKLILVSRAHWSVPQTEAGSRVRLVIHEYLGIINDRDEGWVLSNALLNEIRGLLDPMVLGAHTISTCQELDEKLRRANETDTYVLVRDIDCNETADWNEGRGFKPISVFAGHLNGRGHKITGLAIRRSGSETPAGQAVAPIVRLDGSIRNIKFVNSSIHSNRATAGLVGQNFGTIEEVELEGDVTGSSAAGLVSENFENVTRSAATVRLWVVEGDGYSSVGGLVSVNRGTGVVDGGQASGDMRGHWSAGGLVGWNFGVVTGANCGVRDTSVLARVNAGGIVGKNEGGQVRGCSSKARVSSQGVAGGIVGYNLRSGRIQLNTFKGRVCGTDEKQAFAGLDYEADSTLNGRNISEGNVAPCE